MPRWLNFLRTTLCSSSPCLQMLDDVQRKTLFSITNVHFGDNSWIQATLPVHWGGLGVRSIVDLAPSAFRASSCLVRPLVALLSPAALIGFLELIPVFPTRLGVLGWCISSERHHGHLEGPCSVRGTTRCVRGDYSYFEWCIGVWRCTTACIRSNIVWIFYFTPSSHLVWVSGWVTRRSDYPLVCESVVLP